MAVKPRRRPCRILRLNSADTALIAAATADSYLAPSYGWEALTLAARLTQAGTVEVYQRMRSSSSWMLTDQYVFAAAGVLRDTVQITDELVRVLFTNGGVAQSPEILATLV